MLADRIFSANPHLDHDWIPGLWVWGAVVTIEAKATSPDAETFARHVEVLSKKMQKVQQQLAQHL